MAYYMPWLANAAGGGGGETAPVSTTNHYFVRDGGSPTGDGSDWTNARDDLPTTLVRDTTYWIADGTYAGRTFSTAASGSTIIQIRKATAAYHGTDTGWDAAYGNGVAAFSGGFVFGSAYWVIDGATGGGYAAWNSGHGFEITETGSTSSVLTNLGNSNITVKHAKLIGMNNSGTGGGGLANDGVLFESAANLTISHCWFFGIGRCPFFSGSVGNTTAIFEHNYVTHFWANDGNEIHGEILSTDGVSNGCTFDFRYNLFTSVRSTGGLMWDNDTGNSAEMRVYGNVFYMDNSDVWSDANGVLGGWTGGSGEECRNFLVYNNTFINVTPTQILSTFPAVYSGNVARNNLFYTCVDVGGGSVWETVTHNHFISTTTLGTNTSTSTGDPFQNYVGFDFRLVGNTTAGTDLGGAPYNVDMYGNTRTTWTRGAIEFTG